MLYQVSDWLFSSRYAFGVHPVTDYYLLQIFDNS